MRRRELKKSCKRSKCPYYKMNTNKCYSCELNPDSVWTERKVKK